jgi:Fe-S oxidoreductase
MVTKEEAHSTRGRANTLRLALNGTLGDAKLSDQGVYDVLDLCLECRACKAECPVGVDVGRFKSEFLAGYWKEHGTPASVRAIGQIRMLLESGSRFPGIANAVARSTPFRWLADAMFGIDRRRPLPRLAAQTFAEKAAKDRTGSGSPGGAAVIVFNDTFTNYCHPQIGSAAVAVLRAAGCAPQVVGHGCCGRPLISKGLLDDAKRLAEANVTALYADAARGTPIVFLEPSCLSAIREDGPDLLRGDAQRRAKVVAGASILFEDLVERRIQAKETPLAFAAGPRTVLLHGHCHQKAMGMMPAARALLVRIPQATVTDLDAGCCGMAGSFGYAREHYDVSQLIGERRLLPAARAMDRDAVLVASGTSCREQVAHFAGVRALHSAELLEPLIRTAP